MLGAISIFVITLNVSAELLAFTLLIQLICRFQWSRLIDHAEQPSFSIRIPWLNGSVHIFLFRLHFHRLLRIIAISFYILTNASRIGFYYSFISAGRIVTYWVKDKKHHLWSLFFNVFFWITLEAYALTVLDRFERIDMILPKTVRYYCLRCVQLFTISAAAFLSTSQAVCHIYWILHSDTIDICKGAFKDTRDLIAVFTGLLLTVLELAINIKLVISSFSIKIQETNSNVHKSTIELVEMQQSHCQLLVPEPKNTSISVPASTQKNESYSQLTSNLPVTSRVTSKSHSMHMPHSIDHALIDLVAKVGRTRKIQKRKQYYFKGVKIQLVFYFILLIVFDIAIVACFVISNLGVASFTNENSRFELFEELNAFATALVSVHFYVGFLLLDLFYLQLRKAKEMTFESRPPPRHLFTLESATMDTSFSRRDEESFSPATALSLKYSLEHNQNTLQSDYAASLSAPPTITLSLK